MLCSYIHRNQENKNFVNSWAKIDILLFFITKEEWIKLKVMSNLICRLAIFFFLKIKFKITNWFKIFENNFLNSYSTSSDAYKISSMLGGGGEILVNNGRWRVWWIIIRGFRIRIFRNRCFDSGTQFRWTYSGEWSACIVNKLPRWSRLNTARYRGYGQ